MYIAAFLVLGVIAGMLSGIIGIGGGIIIVPALVYIFGFTQQQAQGTTLALLVPPIGILAAWAYWRQGFVDVKVAALICIGFFIGGLFGGKFATELPAYIITRVFAVALIAVGVKMLIFQ